ncbi:thioesterase family protein [Agrococcus baldri]|uniref:Thioesterase n=1 Tax=Agrococcus baldri TaxID=153730 RepID=A0AA87RKK4_9MICO|nr:thioesterase family protein [Agrococcus baldri]GEK80903.1 thioesterase [Agrococcus baldri]
MWLQWLLAMTVKSKGRPALGIDGVARTPFVVLPTDIDLLGHMNNGRYLSYMDLARVDMTNRTGMAAVLDRAGIYAVVGQSTMVYRRSLDLWQRFDIETAVLGADERAIYLQQRFVVDGEVHARGVVQGRFIERGVGTAPIARVVEVLEAAGLQVPLPELDQRVHDWAEMNRLPSNRQAAPSSWAGRTPR